MNAYVRTALIGVVAGMRSMTAPAGTSRYLARVRPEDLVDSPLSWFGTQAAANAFAALAAGEIAADKLPSIPPRVQPGPLIGRAVSGALCGAALCAAEGEGMVEGAVVGAVAAVASTHLFYQLRKRLGERTPLPASILAVLEDITAIGLVRQALQTAAA